MLTPQIPVAKEGYPFIAFAAFCTLMLALFQLPCSTTIGIIVTTFVLCFFRDPERFLPSTREDALVSPADGKVIHVETVATNPFIEGEVKKVAIFMNVFNVHVNRVPFSGTVDKILYKPGKFYSADSDKSSLENEYLATVITTPQNKKVAFVQIAGLIARRIVCWLEAGDEVIRGRRFGLIRFGSRVDLYLPANTDIVVQKGDKVRAGETVLGYLL